MSQDFGIYQAIVTDNTSFFITGKIMVRIQKFYNETLNWDMSKNYDDKEYWKELMNDIPAFVHTTIGGGSNYGMLSLPQINSAGIVQFLNGDYRNPVWMGSIFVPEYVDKKINLNIPNDNIDSEGIGSSGLYEGTKKTKSKSSAIILRTKSTESSTGNKPDNMNFDKKRSENLIVLSDAEARLVHFSKWIDKNKGNNSTIDQFEEITINSSTTTPSVDIKITENNATPAKLKTTGIRITPSEASLEVMSKEKKIISKVSATTDGISISSVNTSNSKDNTLIVQTPTNIIINNKSLMITMGKSSSGVQEIVISSPSGNIRLSGKEVILGDGGGYVMVKDNKLPVKLKDGSILKASNVRA